MATSTFGTTDPNAQGTQNVNNAASSGSSAIGSFDPNAWASNTQSGYNSMWGNQAQGNQNLVSAFKNQIASQPSATDYYNQGMNAFNVPQLQQNANQLNAAVLNAPNSNLAAARGFQVDQNQVDQKTSQDLQRLEPAAQAAQGYASTAQQNAIAYQNAGLQQNQMNMTPLQQQATSQAQLYAAQATGYGAQQQQQLQALQDKMDQGVSLSASEMTAYASLAQQESAYQQSLATANAGVQEAQIGQQYQKLIPGESLYNVQNGKPAQQLATNAPTIGSGGTINYGAGGGYYPSTNTNITPPASAYLYSGQPNNNIG